MAIVNFASSFPRRRESSGAQSAPSVPNLLMLSTNAAHLTGFPPARE